MNRARHNELFPMMKARRPEGYCFDAVHLPVQPSDCRNVPPPLRPDRRPVVMTVMPLPVEVPYTVPSGPTVPLAVWPIILPLVTTTALLLVP